LIEKFQIDDKAGSESLRILNWPEWIIQTLALILDVAYTLVVYDCGREFEDTELARMDNSNFGFDLRCGLHFSGV
jgi:hypothetical protein